MTPFSLLRRSSGPVRFRLLRDLVLLLVFTVGLLVAINILLIDDIKQDLAESRIEAATTLVQDAVQGLLFPVRQQLLIIRDGLESAQINPAQAQALNQRLIPILAHMPQIAGAIDAAADGREYFLRREGDGWLTRLRGPGDQAQIRLQRWDESLHPQDERQVATDYDPRTRPWFLEAVENPGQLVWSPPYVFASLEVPGITVALAWSQSEQVRVTALDVTLQSIFDTIEGLTIGTDGRGFLFSGAGGVFAPRGIAESHPRDHRSNTFFSAQARLGGPLPFDAVAAWKAADAPENRLVRFHSGGKNWWSGFRPLTDDRDGAWVGVALPISETLIILQSRWHIIAATALGILAASLGLTWLVVRKYSRQLRDLPKLSIDRRHSEQDLRELIAGGEGAHLELKSTMRTNLHTKSPGKEIELAWLKGVAAFMNTEGGILLMGVADDGTTLGLDADRFENEDKAQLHFKNLLNQHLGPEYARFVRFSLHDLDGLRVGAVECERSDHPAILRDDKQRERFIIRSGPSNIELPISRALKYIRSRF